jgi:hypothetical protein
LIFDHDEKRAWIRRAFCLPSPLRTSYNCLMPYYPSIIPTVLKCLLARITGRKRSAHMDAVHLCAQVQPPILYDGMEHLDLKRPYVVTVNHFARTGFSTAWIALGVSAALPPEVIWIMSNEWLFLDSKFAFILRPLMRFVLKGITDAYSLIPMPTMVQGYSTSQARAAGVRETVQRVRADKNCIVGIAPEGMDSPEGGLMLPPSGVGRFLLQLQQMGLSLLPAAVFEAEDSLHIRFGPAYHLEPSEDQTSIAVDLAARQQVMANIAGLMN